MLTPEQQQKYEDTLELRSQWLELPLLIADKYEKELNERKAELSTNQFAFYSGVPNFWRYIGKTIFPIGFLCAMLPKEKFTCITSRAIDKSNWDYPSDMETDIPATFDEAYNFFLELPEEHTRHIINKWFDVDNFSTILKSITEKDSQTFEAVLKSMPQIDKMLIAINCLRMLWNYYVEVDVQCVRLFHGFNDINGYTEANVFDMVNKIPKVLSSFEFWLKIFGDLMDRFIPNWSNELIEYNDVEQAKIFNQQLLPLNMMDFRNKDNLKVIDANKNIYNCNYWSVLVDCIFCNTYTPIIELRDALTLKEYNYIKRIINNSPDPEHLLNLVRELTEANTDTAPQSAVDEVLEKARPYFDKAVELKIMSKSEDGNYKLSEAKGTVGLVAYLCGKIFCGDKVKDDKNVNVTAEWERGQKGRFPDKELMLILGLDKSLLASRKTRPNPPKNWKSIDLLVYEVEKEQ